MQRKRKSEMTAREVMDEITEGSRYAMPAQAAPVVELRGVKHAAFASEETECFEATVYVDGRPLCRASNDGHGGADFFEPCKGGPAPRDLDAAILDLARRLNPLAYGRDHVKVARVEALTDAEIEAMYEGDWWLRGEHGAEEILSGLVGRLLSEHLIGRDLARSFKRKVLFLKPGESGVYEIPHRGRAAEAIEHLAKKYPGAVILNAKPLVEAVAIMRERGQ